MTPGLSVIIPIHNRTSLFSHPLRSLREASQAAPTLHWELIIVDDASTEDVAKILTDYPDLPIQLVKFSKNQGLLAARLAGLKHARGEAVFFLDADDGITIEKFTHQLPALFAQRADVVTSDVARCSLDSTGRKMESLRFDPPTRASENPAEFYIAVQPAPHDPIFRREYLQNILNAPLFPPSRDYDSIAETWFYYQLSVHPAKIFRVPGAWSIVGESTSDRLSHHWERQCAAALRLMQNFVTHCPKTEFGQNALRVMGRCAFSTWRALPHSFPPADRFLKLWQSCPPAELEDLGGRTFKRVAQILGPIVAGRIFKRFQRPHYSKARTIPEDQLSHLFA